MAMCKKARTNFQNLAVNLCAQREAMQSLFDKKLPEFVVKESDVIASFEILTFSMHSYSKMKV